MFYLNNQKHFISEQEGIQKNIFLFFLKKVCSFTKLENWPHINLNLKKCIKKETQLKFNWKFYK